jgi:hypothetical protein
VVSIKIMVETVHQTMSVRFSGNLAEIQECEQARVGLESKVLDSDPAIMMRLRLQLASSPFGYASRLACQLMSALQSGEE